MFIKRVGAFQIAWKTGVLALITGCVAFLVQEWADPSPQVLAWDRLAITIVISAVLIGIAQVALYRLAVAKRTDRRQPLVLGLKRSQQEDRAEDGASNGSMIAGRR